MPKNKKVDYEYERPRVSRADWMDALVTRIQQQPSILNPQNPFQTYYDLTGLVSNQTKKSVEDVVNDLRKRVGLDHYLNMVASTITDEKFSKIAMDINLSVSENEIIEMLHKAEIVDEKISNIIQAVKDMVDRSMDIPVIVIELNKLFGRFGLTEEVTGSEPFKVWISNLIAAHNKDKPDEVMDNVGKVDQEKNEQDYQENQDFMRNMKA